MDQIEKKLNVSINFTGDDQYTSKLNSLKVINLKLVNEHWGIGELLIGEIVNGAHPELIGSRKSAITGLVIQIVWTMLSIPHVLAVYNVIEYWPGVLNKTSKLSVPGVQKEGNCRIPLLEPKLVAFVNVYPELGLMDQYIK